MKAAIAFALVVTATAASAQSDDLTLIELDKVKAASGLFAAREVDVLELKPLAPQPGIRNAPFSADAVTEFEQLLGDGNRIERSVAASIARDSQGRTRREQQVAMVGPLASLKRNMARLVVISDPATGVDYTLDEDERTARRSTNTMQLKVRVLELVEGKITRLATSSYNVAKFDDKAKVEALGTRQIEGVAAEGTRTTTTIAAGAIGNVHPIDIVTERWFSRDLQMDVLVSRRDPRTGETVYRLRNIIRSEPPADLFVVPSNYRIIGPERTVWTSAARSAEKRKARIVEAPRK